MDTVNEARAMAVKVLLGLAKDANIKQMLNKKVRAHLKHLLLLFCHVIDRKTNTRSCLDGFLIC